MQAGATEGKGRGWGGENGWPAPSLRRRPSAPRAALFGTATEERSRAELAAGQPLPRPVPPSRPAQEPESPSQRRATFVASERRGLPAQPETPSSVGGRLANGEGDPGASKKPGARGVRQAGRAGRAGREARAKGLLGSREKGSHCSAAAPIRTWSPSGKVGSPAGILSDDCPSVVSRPTPTPTPPPVREASSAPSVRSGTRGGQGGGSGKPALPRVASAGRAEWQAEAGKMENGRDASQTRESA